ncbi:MAG: 4-alpha-glucanotransferase [Pelotomaculum sp.]|nr:4-alpha-glucanotransferase [Pelotomaculum sp.]
MSEKQITLLYRLARLYGIETVYRDFTGNYRHAPLRTLLAALRALGAPVTYLSDVPDAVREKMQEKWRHCCEPVAVAWSGKPAPLALRLPARLAECLAGFRLVLENGKEFRWARKLARLPLLQAVRLEGVGYELRRLDLPSGLPWGYHQLKVELPAGQHEVLIISAPWRAYTAANKRLWGVFIPLYALHSARSWGAGDFTDLEELLRWTHSLGGGMAGTLPLLAAFLDEPFSPSPYEPVSRLFWNEFYLDICRVEELKRSSAARELLASPAFQREVAELRQTSLVDYRRIMSLKRRILEHCAKTCYAENSGRLAGLHRWARENPAAQDYACFRAAAERQRSGWPEWPARMKEGHIQEGDYDPEAKHYHLYVQWLAHQQLKNLSARARERGQSLYLDFPLGVHSAGYDVWRERNVFATGASCGAPPDPLYSKGQNWGFPPLHPERIREQGYRYFSACLRNHLQYAGILRLDHIMGLHHLYWVPEGFPATEGVYVRYRAEEFYAILTLESNRHKAVIVGEDLGTVPGYVRTGMCRHELHRMYIMALELKGRAGRVLQPVPAVALAALNTHDTPPFAAFWRSRKGTVERVALPVFLYRQGHLAVPTTQTRAVLEACLKYLAASRARLFLVNMEDLWMETLPQNVPGTAGEYPNWHRKARHALEEFCQMPEVVEVLHEISFLRDFPACTGKPQLLQ